MRSGSVEKAAGRVASGLIGAVSFFFRALGWRACRFHPSCSCYAREAFAGQNFFRASVLTAGRILRCHPFSRGGFDPVPGPLNQKES